MAMMFLLQACTGDSDKKDESSILKTTPLTTIQNFSIGSAGNFNMKLLSTNQNGQALDCDDENEQVFLDIMNDDGVYERVNSDSVQLKCNKQGQGQVAMVIDNTGSVKDIITQIKSGANSILDQVILGEGSASITRVSTNSKICTEVISDATKLRSTVEEQLFAGNGWTALYDGIRMGNETLIRSNANFDTKTSSVCGNMPNRGIVVFTDGNENNSSDEKSYSYDRSRFPGDYIDTSLDDLLAMDVNGIKVPVYTIGMGTDVDHETLESLASKSGGRHFKVENGQEVEVAFELISKYFNAAASVCANVSKAMCGTRHIKITRENKSSGSGSSETTTYTANIPCEKEDLRSTTEESVLVNQNDKSTSFSGTDVSSQFSKNFYLPGFDNELGTKELTDVIITYDLKSSSHLEEGVTYTEKNTEFTSKTNIKISSNFRYHSLEDSNSASNNSSLDLVNTPINLIQNNITGSYRVLSHDFYKFINVDSYKVNVAIDTGVSFINSIGGSLSTGLSGKIHVSYKWKKIENPKIKILDPSFEYLVRRLSGNKYGLISSSDVLSITKLDLSKRNLKSLEGLQFFSNLEEIILSKNELSNISTLGKLKKLRKVILDENSISNISALSNLENLEYLSIKKNTLADLSSLSLLTKLTSLYVSNNNISNIDSLSKLVNLKVLSLSNNKNLVDISALKEMSNLTKLYLSNNSLITDFSVLNNLIKLYYLNLTGIRGINLSQVVTCPLLSTLVLNNTLLKDYSILEKVGTLKTLYVKSNKIEDTSSFENLKINYLNLSNNLINSKHWESLSKIVTLTGLVLDSNQITSIENVSSLSNLTSLSAKYNKIINISGVSSLLKLRSLSLSDNLISDLTSLASLANSLKYLYVSKNKITDISSLEKLVNLIEISLGDNFELIKTQALSTLKGLVKVWLYNTLAESFSFITNSENLSYLNLLNTSIDCGVQKSIVSKQYEGLSAKYDLASSCGYAYDPKSSGPTVTTTLETQKFDVSQFNIFTVNAEKTNDEQSNDQSLEFKAFDSVLGTRKIVSAKLIYNLTANILHSAFQVGTSEITEATLNSLHEINITPNLSSMETLNALADSSLSFEGDDVYTLTEEELDSYISNPEQELPYALNSGNALAGEYAFSDAELVNLNNGQDLNLKILQSVSGSLQDSSHKSVHGIFNSHLSGSITLELTVQD